MRSKEESHDYRYFPDPDLPPLLIKSDRIESLKDSIPELPHKRKKRLIEEFDLSEEDVEVLTSSRSLADYFEDLATLVEKS